MASVFKAKFGDKTFELDRLTLGDWRLLKREFGLTAADMVEGGDEDGEDGRLKMEDPDVLAGMLLCALVHEQPNKPVSVLLAEIDDLELQDLEIVADEEDADAADPQTAADDAATAKPASKAKGRNQGTRQKTSGSPR